MARKFYTKRIISPGTYLPRDQQGNPKIAHVSKDRLTKAVDTFTKMRSKGMLIPAPFRHTPRATPVTVGTGTFTKLPGDSKEMVNLPATIEDDDSYNNGGYWDKVWQDSEGALWGRIFSDRPEAQERIATTVRECSPTLFSKWKDGKGEEFEEAMTHIALVTHPVQSAQDNFIGNEPMPEDALTISMSEFAYAENFAEMVGESVKTKVPESTVDDPDTSAVSSNISNATVKDVLKALEGMGIKLPDDTSGENFVERLLGAILAIQNSGNTDSEGTTTRPPDGSKTETAGAITMSKFVEVKNPFNDQAPPVKLEFANAEQFSAFTSTPVQNFSMIAEENSALKKSLLDAAVKGVTSRIKALSKKGLVTKEYYDTHLAPLLASSESFSLQNGSYVHPSVDAILTALEASGPHPLLDKDNLPGDNFATNFAEGPSKGAQVLDPTDLFTTEAGANTAQPENRNDKDKELFEEVYKPYLATSH